jgi:hypothetical protein
MACYRDSFTFFPPSRPLRPVAVGRSRVKLSFYEFISAFEGKGKVVPVLNQALRHEDVWGSGCIHPRILYRSTSRPGRFTPEKEPTVPIG